MTCVTQTLQWNANNNNDRNELLQSLASDFPFNLNGARREAQTPWVAVGSAFCRSQHILTQLTKHSPMLFQLQKTYFLIMKMLDFPSSAGDRFYFSFVVMIILEKIASFNKKWKLKLSYIDVLCSCWCIDGRSFHMISSVDMLSSLQKKKTTSERLYIVKIAIWSQCGFELIIWSEVGLNNLLNFLGALLHALRWKRLVWMYKSQWTYPHSFSHNLHIIHSLKIFVI